MEIITVSCTINWVAQKLTGENLKLVLGQVFNNKLGCFADVHVLIYVDARPHLYLKTRPGLVLLVRVCPYMNILCSSW